MRAVVFLLLCSATVASAREHWMNPGTMGANALPTFALEAPWVEDFTLVQVGTAAQLGWRGDTSVLPTFRLLTPFGKWAEMIFEGAAVEWWWSSEQTRREWSLVRTEGVAKADIRFGFKVLLGQRMRSDHGVTIDLCTAVGYWIWQQQESGQNDAVHWALSLQVQPKERWTFAVEARGYIGWQSNDKPIVMGVRAGFLFTDFFELGATMNVGMVDAPRLEGRLDLKFRLPSLVPLLFEKDPIAAASSSTP